MKPEDKLQKILELLPDNTITPAELEQFILLVLNVIKESKDKFEQMSREGMGKIQEALDYMEKEHEEHEEEMDEEMKEMVGECKKMCEEYLKHKPKDGKDGETPDTYPIMVESARMVEERLMPLLPKAEDITKDVMNKTYAEMEELRNEIEDLKKEKRTTIINGGVIGRDLIKDLDISSQLDGATKTFNIQAVWNIISVDLSSFPYGSLRKNVDYTWTPTSITFTDQIDAPTQLATGQSCILTVVQG